MNFDHKPYLDRIVAAFTEAVNDAYSKGGDDAVQRLLAAAQGISAMPPAASAANPSPIMVDDQNSEKAPRGTVGNILHMMLSHTPGRPTSFYEANANTFDHRVAPKSIGNELRRMEGKKYQRNEAGEWFLINSDGEAAGHATNDEPAAS